jgi:hypothetical protein
MSSLGGGVGGAGNANNGSGQTGMVGSVFYPNSVQGEQPAFYLNNSTDFQAENIASTSLPPFTPTNSPRPNITPGVNTGNYVTSSGVGVSPQGVGTLDPMSANRSPYSETWNVGVQRAISRNLVLSINYVGSESHFLYGANNGFLQNEINPKYEALGPYLPDLPTAIVNSSTGETAFQAAQAIDPSLQIPYSNFGSKTGTIQAMLSPFPQYGGISDVYNDTGTAAYSGLEIILSQRTWHGLDFTVNYTYSREMDSSACCRTGYNIPASAITDGIARQQRALDYSEHDPRQVLHTYGTYDLPFGKGHIGGSNPFVNLIASNWQASGIYSYTSGAILGFGASGCRAVGLGCNPSFNPAFHGNVRIHGNYGQGINALTAATTPFLNADAFFVPNQTYQVGDVPATGGFNAFGPGFWEIDGGLSRTFKIREGMSFVFGTQVQNLTNHFSWGGPSTTINQLQNPNDNGGVTGPGGNWLATNTHSNFGTLRNSGQPPRDWQFSGKIVF